MSLSDEPTLPMRGQAAVPDVISALSRHDGHLAAREQQVADYVKAHMGEISTLTIAELAEGSGVSKPTVIRFCRTLGCEGFREFKLRLAQNLAVSRQYLEPKPDDNLNAPDSAVDQILSSLYSTATVMRQQLDVATLEKAAAAIVECRQLVVAGIGGGSAMLAEEAANRFFRLGIPCTAISDSYVLQMRAATLGQADTLLQISASGEADAIVGAAKVARSYGATTVSITRPDTRLAEVSHLPITVELPETTDIFLPTTSRYIHLIIIDALALTVARARADRTLENLRRIRASLTAYHGRIGPQPLGD